MSIKVSQYIDQNSNTVEAVTDYSSVSAVSGANESSFDETFEQAQRALDAMNIDAALDQVKSSGGSGISLTSRLAYELGITKTYNTPTPVAAQSSQAQSQTPAIEHTPHDPIARSSHYTNLSPSHSGTNGHNNTGLLKCDPNLQIIFEEASEATGVDVKLIKSICFAESSFRTDLVCSNGATGAMMLMPVAMQEYGVTDGTDPHQNIIAGAEILADKLNEFHGDLTLAAAAYNAGSNAVHKYGGVPPYQETQNYVKKIAEFYNS